ncbi:hypothetical protein [Anaerovorax odorimutans]|uniref:hypothetical protein n=1 Tax=Anaerovorax odorimutans TaxID=109327 RepID=UPI00041C071F|nr:hypothetical protein [Anaerovorax odorimutans]
MNSIFVINGTEYDVSVLSIQREATILTGDNAGRLKNGNVVRDVTGTIYNFEFEVSSKTENATDYDNLYEIITAPVESYPVSVPFGQGFLDFDAYINTADDELMHMGSKNLWNNLIFTAAAMEPQRYYGENWSIGAGTGNGVFTIDGVGFNAVVKKLERKGKVLELNSDRFKSGAMNREIVGTYYNYSMQIEQDNIEQYDRLYYALTAPVDSHSITIPYGQNTLTFNAYITQVRDNLTYMSGNINKWGGLEVDFSATAPERT